MCACRGETSGCKINHASSESKQGVEEGWGGGKKRKIKSTSAKQQPLKSISDVDALSKDCLFVFRSRDMENGCVTIGVSKSVYDEITGSALGGKLSEAENI